MRFNWGRIFLVLSLIFSIGVLYASNLKNNKRLINKIQNLKAFYNRTISKNEIDKYKKINLRFENQVVVVKK